MLLAPKSVAGMDIEIMREDERGTCQVFWILLDSFGLVPDVFVCIFVELTDVFFHCFWNDGIDC
jgi:hypothetical protein